MADERQRRPAAQVVGDRMIDAHDEGWKAIMKSVPKDAPKLARGVAHVAFRTPGLIYNAANIARAEDPLRATFGFGGGFLGGLAGGALGGATGLGLGAPVGAMAGSHLGEEIGEDIYDRNKAQIQATKRWVEDRNRDILRGLYGRRNAPPVL